MLPTWQTVRVQKPAWVGVLQFLSSLGFLVAIGLAYYTGGGEGVVTEALITAVSLTAAMFIGLAFLMKRFKQLGTYGVDGDRLHVGTDVFDLSEPYFATVGHIDRQCLVRIAQGQDTAHLLLRFPGFGYPGYDGELEPPDITRRRLAAYFSGIDEARLERRGTHDFAEHVLSALSSSSRRNTATGARARVPAPDRAPEPQTHVAREIPFDGAAATSSGPYRAARPTLEDGPRFVADFRTRANEVADGVHVDADYVVWTRDGSSLVLPIGSVKAIAAGSHVRVVALGEDGDPIDASIPMDDPAGAHFLAEDLHVAFEETQGPTKNTKRAR